MEFNFNINEVFKSPIVEITHNLIPPGYTGERRALWDAVSKVAEVVNEMGAASAAAQGLTKAITTADRMRNSEHKLYFLTDPKANNGKGAITGMLKTGNKSLYVFDRDGNHYQVSPPCLLDFYVHETKQRSGLGKTLFEHMLEKEGIEPVQMAIDRPSEKLLRFLNKHYNLNNPVKQMNNYVVFDDFFPKRSLTASTPMAQVEGMRSKTPQNPNCANGLQGHVEGPMGRYGAPRPPCSMGQIIHNQAPTDQRQAAAGVQSMPATNYQGYQQTYSPDNAAYITQSTPNMYYGTQQTATSPTNYNPYQVQGQMQANYQNVPAQNWQQDPNMIAQSYGTSGEMVQGTTSAYPVQNQNVAQATNYQYQNMGQFTPQDAVVDSGYATTYSQSYQPPNDKALQNISGTYQYQQGIDPNSANMQAANMMADAQQAVNAEAANMAAAQEQNAQQQAANVAAQQAANVAAQQQDANTAAQQATGLTTQQEAANVSAQQQAANMAAQQQAANMAAQQQAANMAAQQQAANMAAQQQAANMAAQQQAVNMAAQQQAANMAAQQQAANMAAQQQATLAAQQQAANLAAQQQAANLAAQQQAATLAAQQQAANMAAQQQSSNMTVASGQTNDMAAQQQAANVAAQQQAAQQQANILAAQQLAASILAGLTGQYAANQVQNMVPQQVTAPPLQAQYNTLMPAVTPQSYNPVTTVQSVPLRASPAMAQFATPAQSMPNFNNQNAVQSGVSLSNFNQNNSVLTPGVAQNFAQATEDHMTKIPRVASANMALQANRNQYQQQDVAASALTYPNAALNYQSQGDNQMSNVLKQNVDQMQNETNENRVNEKGDRPSSASMAKSGVCGADLFKVTDKIRVKNDGSDFIKKSDESAFKYGYPPQISHGVQKETVPSNPVKLERPRSLVIHQEEPLKPMASSKNENDKEEDDDKDSLADSIDVGVEELDLEEPVKEKNKVRGATENFLCAESKTPSPRKTPSHLTEQGYFDLKFYHNKLW